MNFLLKSKPKRNYNSKIVVAISLFILLFLVSFLFPNFLRSSLVFSMRPLWNIRDKTVKIFYFAENYISFKSSLVKEKTRMEEELATLRLIKIDYDFLLKENEKFRDDFGRSGSTQTIVSSVLSKPPQSPYDTFIIDAGSDTGVSVGDKAFASNSILLGVVSSVTNHTSIIKLFSSGGEKNEVILSRTGASYVLMGNGGANFRIEVPKETDMLWGDSFQYPGLESSVVAVVYFVDSNSQSSFKTVHLRVPGNVFQISKVYIEK